MNEISDLYRTRISVENTTEATLKQVRVEVHLSNGTELGPMPPLIWRPVKKEQLN